MYYLFNSNGRTASTVLNIFIKPANDAPLIAVGFNSLQITIKVFLLIINSNIINSSVINYNIINSSMINSSIINSSMINSNLINFYDTI